MKYWILEIAKKDKRIYVPTVSRQMVEGEIKNRMFQLQLNIIAESPNFLSYFLTVLSESPYQANIKDTNLVIPTSTKVPYVKH